MSVWSWSLGKRVLMAIAFYLNAFKLTTGPIAFDPVSAVQKAIKSVALDRSHTPAFMATHWSPSARAVTSFFVPCFPVAKCFLALEFDRCWQLAELKDFLELVPPLVCSFTSDPPPIVLITLSLLLRLAPAVGLSDILPGLGFVNPSLGHEVAEARI